MRRCTGSSSRTTDRPVTLLEHAWQSRWHPLSWLLLPLSWVFSGVAALRRLGFRRGWKPVVSAAVPVIVVGNLSVGGVGKTPLVLWLASRLRDQGWRVGIVSRGYGRQSTGLQRADAHSEARLVGDEPLLFARAGFPVAVAERRVQAAQALERDVDIVIADDGLQHYAMARAAEIVVVDGKRGFGNGRALPAGPLREPVSRLASVDLVLVRDGDPEDVLPASNVDMFRYDVEPSVLQSLDGRNSCSLTDWRGRRVHAVAGIGFPERFFAALEAVGLRVIPHAFADHHDFRVDDLAFGDDLPVLMTGKDAVKCRGFAQADWWVVDVAVHTGPALDAAIDRLTRRVLGAGNGTTESLGE